MHCHVCGNDFKVASAGVKHRKASQKCPECNEELPPGVSFCIHCGYDQETQQSMFQKATAAVATPAVSSDQKGNDRLGGSKREAEKAGKLDLKLSLKQKYVSQRREAGRAKKLHLKSTVRQKFAINRGDDKNTITDRGSTLLTMSIHPNMLLCAVVLAPVVMFFSYLFQAELSGPGFLACYGALLAGCWIFSELCRDEENSRLLVGIAIATFLAVGGMRFYYGYFLQGMEKFNLLFLMMAAGSILIAVGLWDLFGVDNQQGIKFYAFPLGIAFALTAGCVLWTTMVGKVIMCVAVLFMGLIAMVFGRISSGGFSSSCSSCGSSCGGGGGCGGCGGD